MPTLCFPITFPVRTPILSSSFSRPDPTDFDIFARSASVAASRSSLFRARETASAGLRQREILLVEQGHLQRPAVGRQ